MEVSTEVVYSLRVLGLPSDASADDVRSAFRRLARTYHPDVAGKQYSRKFEQIAKAYAFLKELPQEGILHTHGEAANRFSRSHDTLRASSSAWEASKSVAQSDAWPQFSLRGVLGKPFTWYKKRLERTDAEKEQLRRVAEDAQKKVLLENEARVNSILNHGGQLLDDLLSRKEREMQRVGVQGLVLRLASGNCQVRHLALANLGEMSNKPEIFEAMSNSLQKWDIDDKTARLVSALPLKPEHRGKLARALAGRAAVIPDSFLPYLLYLHTRNHKNPPAADHELLELYLRHAGASGIILILRRWPQGAFVSEPTLCRLISHEDESVLAAVLNAMKQRSVPCPESALERMNALLSHPSMVVRVWAKALLSATETERSGYQHDNH